MERLIWIIVSGSLMLMCIDMKRESIALEKELIYISNRIETIIKEPAGFILIPSQNQGVKKVAGSMNRLLEKYYRSQIEHNKALAAIQGVFTNISHDLRTPFTVLSGYTEILLLRAHELNLQREIIDKLKKIDTKAQELLSLIEKIFQMAKLESGDIIFDISSVDISALCRETLLEYYDILEKKDIEVSINIDDKPIYLETDVQAIKRILKNLIDNAIKHGGDGKYLGISLLQQQKEVIIEVEDHGKGIQKKDIEKIFNRRFTTGKWGESSGLGLTITKNMLMQMGNKIDVRSEPGIFTIFSVHFKSKN